MRWRWAVAAVVVAMVPGRVAAQFDSGIPVGSKAPIVSVHDLDGKAVDLGQYIGKRPVLLEFWATWCPLCKQLLPQLDRVHRKYGDQVTMIGINITVNDSKDRVRRYLELHQPPYLALFDDQGVSSRAYEVATTSYVVIIDKAGKVVYTGSGGDQDLVAAVGKAVGR